MDVNDFIREDNHTRSLRQQQCPRGQSLLRLITPAFRWVAGSSMGTLWHSRTI